MQTQFHSAKNAMMQMAKWFGYEKELVTNMDMTGIAMFVVADMEHINRLRQLPICVTATTSGKSGTEVCS